MAQWWQGILARHEGRQEIYLAVRIGGFKGPSQKIGTIVVTSPAQS
jgi:hypothetical protein